MKNAALRLSFIAMTTVMLIGCGSGYTKSGGQWTFININEAVGREVRKMDADIPTVRVLGKGTFFDTVQILSPRLSFV